MGAIDLAYLDFISSILTCNLFIIHVCQAYNENSSGYTESQASNARLHNSAEGYNLARGSINKDILTHAQNSEEYVAQVGHDPIRCKNMQ